ncbi:MAG: N-acetyl-gamma-glutamyl-phosphate reductase [Limnochordia bacterium]|nr:N-acetyl-gamma-glutamyl-phosphate reductase [Limnochordia bacterium]MDD2630364.1 N-acetyl-gamma-glutamyl-phosphate reductase [Limnochordia bacterium]MDD4517681.1 N-acetyl-gamma-glutamyl-phosphate reductase [Limnochordia bacterium]
MIRVGIIGASGYAGRELIRLLLNHPFAKVTYAGSRTYVGEPLGKATPAFRHLDLKSSEINTEMIKENCDCLFTAVPHGGCMALAEEVLAGGVKLIDLGTDFRFRDVKIYEEWYGIEHVCPELSKTAVYGLCELYKEQIKGADLVANPGCYPTSIILGLAPLLSKGYLDLASIVSDSMSGVSGAGATAKPMYHYPECTENLRAYGLISHRHRPEIEQELSALAGQETMLTFTPHLVPMTRGIHSTISGKLVVDVNESELFDLYQDFYADAYFVRVLTEGNPETKAVYGTNFCDMTLRVDPRMRRVVILSVIDNLGKGAAGQAIQNMNLLFGRPETEGLLSTALLP